MGKLVQLFLNPGVSLTRRISAVKPLKRLATGNELLWGKFALRFDFKQFTQGDGVPARTRASRTRQPVSTSPSLAMLTVTFGNTRAA